MRRAGLSASAELLFNVSTRAVCNQSNRFITGLGYSCSFLLSPVAFSVPQCSWLTAKRVFETTYTSKRRVGPWTGLANPRGDDTATAPIRSLNGTYPQPAKNFAWSLAYYANIRVGLLNLLSPDAFTEVKTVKKCVVCRGCPTGGAYSASRTSYLD